jgi:hypothetical protein
MALYKTNVLGKRNITPEQGIKILRKNGIKGEKSCFNNLSPMVALKGVLLGIPRVCQKPLIKRLKAFVSGTPKQHAYYILKSKRNVTLTFDQGMT